MDSFENRNAIADVGRWGHTQATYQTSTQVRNNITLLLRIGSNTKKMEEKDGENYALED
jgi:hypothetical protein